MCLPEAYDFLDDVPLLVDLDRINGCVAAGIVELTHGGGEALTQRLDARPQDVREAEKDGKLYTLFLEVAGEFTQVEGDVRTIGIRADDDMSAIAEIEITGAPTVDVVELPRRFERPGSGWNDRRSSGLRTSGHGDQS